MKKLIILIILSTALGACEVDRVSYRTFEHIGNRVSYRTFEVDGMPCISIRRERYSGLSCDWSKYNPQGIVREAK